MPPVVCSTAVAKGRGAPTTMVITESVEPAPLLALTVKVYVPCCVGVPESIPDEDKFTPGGTFPPTKLNTGVGEPLVSKDKP